MDFTGILSAFDGFAILLAISAIAAIKILPNFARWCFSRVITWFSVSAAISALFHKKQDLTKKRFSGSRSSPVHPAFLPTAVESNLSPESRFKLFGAIFGFFSGFFTRFFSFFIRKKRG